MRDSFYLEKLTHSLVILCLLALLPNVSCGQTQRVFEVGELSVYTEPDNGAEVIVDGKRAGITPFQKKISVGNHEIIVKKDMFYDYVDVVTITKGKKNVFVKMNPKFGMIKISTKPAGATVSFNGVVFPGVTPCISERLLAGNVNVFIQLSEYKTIDTVITVDEGKVSILTVEMEKSVEAPTMSKDEYEVQLYENESNTNPYINPNSALDEPVIKHKTSKIDHGFWVKGGLGLSHVWGYGISWSTGDYYSIYPTFHFGVQYTARINRFLGLDAELNFSRTGYQYFNSYSDVAAIEKYKFNGIEIPVVARCYFLKNGLGPFVELGALVNYRGDVTNETVFSDGSKKTAYTKYRAVNCGLVGGLGCDFRIAKLTCTANARAVLEMSRIFADVNYKLVYFQFGVGVKLL